ncbi:kinase-like domain-containing protein [Scleroderma yunnanense]
MARYPKVDPRDLTGLLRKLDEDPFAHGSATEIWRGTWKGPPPAGTHSGWIAIKVIRTASAPDRAEELCRKLKREARLWASLKDPNIVPLLGVVFDMTPSNVPSLVSPYYKNGNLKSYMNQHRTELSSLEMLKMTYQFASGLAYLHKVGVVHGDLKPVGSLDLCNDSDLPPCSQDNVMIGDNREVVVSDFGLSLALETAGFTTKNFYGSVRYTAPELLGFAGVSGSGQFVPKTANGDIWAFAITSTEVP